MNKAVLLSSGSCCVGSKLSLDWLFWETLAANKLLCVEQGQ